MTRVSRYGACFALTSALIISVSAEAQVKTTVLIRPITWDAEPAPWFGEQEREALVEKLQKELGATGRYRIVDAKDVKTVTDSATGKSAIRGAQLLVDCLVTKARKTETKGKPVNVLDLGKSQKVRSTYEIRMDATLTNTRTNMELAEAKIAVSKSYEDAVRSADVGGVNFRKERTYSDESTQHLIQDLAAEAVKVIDARVRDYGWRSVVKGIVNGKPVVLGGKRDGVTAGMHFDIVETTGPLLDDETGEMLDEGEETVVGRLQVSEVKDKVSYCRKLSGRDAKKGDIVRLDESKKHASATQTGGASGLATK